MYETFRSNKKCLTTNTHFHYCFNAICATTLVSLRELSAVSDHDRGLGGARLRSDGLNGSNNSQRRLVSDLAKDNVLAVEPGGGDRRDEELGAVGVWASVCHGELSRLGVLELKVFVRELFAVDGLSASAVAAGKVAALEHELGNDTVERAALVVERLA